MLQALVQSTGTLAHFLLFIGKKNHDSFCRRLVVSHSFAFRVMGGSIVGAVATVKVAQNTKDKELKGKMMNIHKSLALIVLGLVPFRLGARYFSHIPKVLPGHWVEQLAGKASHAALYGFIVGMPVSGIIMGWYGGYGIPFFFTKFQGAATPNKELAGNAYKAHAFMGKILVYFLPIHVGAAGYHLVKGQKIFSRINPF